MLQILLALLKSKPQIQPRYMKPPSTSVRVLSAQSQPTSSLFKPWGEIFPFLDSCSEGRSFCLRAEHVSDSKPRPEGNNPLTKGNIRILPSPFIFCCSHLLLEHLSMQFFLQQGGAGAINRSTLPYIFLPSAFSLPLPVHSHTGGHGPTGHSARGGIIVQVCSAERGKTAPCPKAGSCWAETCSSSILCLFLRGRTKIFWRNPKGTAGDNTGGTLVESGEISGKVLIQTKPAAPEVAAGASHSTKHCRSLVPDVVVECKLN